MSNQEEDATDLNFPKDASTRLGAGGEPRTASEVGSPRGNSVYGLRCGNCHNSLHTPYIECDECPQVLRILNSKIKTTNVFICLECFAKGVQFGVHLSSHDYVIVRDNFMLLEPGWKASDEVSFLDAIKVCGLGNWEKVSRCLKYTKSARQCREHFDRMYLHKKLPEACNRRGGYAPLPYVDGLEDPPRPVLKGPAYYELAGYNAARAEFEVEHDNEAEQIIAGVELDNSCDDPEDGVDGLYDELVYALAGCYQTRLSERQRRKNVLRRHGLISQSKAFVHFNRARAHLPLQLVELFPKLHQLISFNRLSKLIEGFKLESEFQERIRMLKLYRHNGLTRLVSATVFEDLQQSHLSHLRDRRAVLGPGSSDQLPVSLDAVSRKPASLPLDLVGRAGYERLDDEERKLASEIRLVPHDFIRFKNLLTMECKSRGGLSLAQARVSIKIDVNKTRKIYDFLISRNELF